MYIKGNITISYSHLYYYYYLYAKILLLFPFCKKVRTSLCSHSHFPFSVLFLLPAMFLPMSCHPGILSLQT